MTDATGAVISSCTYAPYGEQVACSPDNTSNHYRFTGKERDAETGIDYFGARHYSSRMGRFMTPDWDAGPTTVPYAHLDNPQTLNLYSYVDNNPINGVDPTGHSRNEYMVGGVSWGTSFGYGGWGTTDAGGDFSSETVLVDLNTNIAVIIDNQTGSVTVQAAVALAGSGGQNQQTQQVLSKASENAILRSNLTAAQAIAFEGAALGAGTKYHIDPNILVGLAERESSLDPNAVNGNAKGLFQITPSRQADLKLSNANLSNIKTVVNAVAGSLASAMKTFNGSSSLAITSWTVGVGGTRAAFKAGGMQGVRDLLLDKRNPSYGRVGPDYIDIVQGFQGP